MKSTEQVARWLEDTARRMNAEDGVGCASMFIDEHDHVHSLSVGWIGGYDPKGAGTEFRSRKQPEYCLNAGIVLYNPGDCCDLEYMDMPWDERSGETYDTMVTLGEGADWNGLARFFVKSMRGIREFERSGRRA